MNRLPIVALILSFLFAPTQTSAAKNLCSDLFFSQTPEQQMAHEIVTTVVENPSFKQKYGRKLRGLAVLSAVMVTSAAVSTHLTSALPHDMAFLSQLIGQVSTIGIFVLGAPIWEPISSAFRKFAFGLNDKVSADSPTDPGLEKLWQRTQGQYSINSQMSRNVIHSFLLAAQLNFSEARRSMESQNESLAIDQVAEIAVRMRRLFADIDPADPSVALAIQSSFTRQVVITSDFEEKLKVRIAEFDLDSTAEVKLYYARLMATWLHQKGSRG